MLVVTGIDRMLDSLQDKEQRAIAELFSKLVKEDALPKEDLLSGLQRKLDQLGDLMYVAQGIISPKFSSAVAKLKPWHLCPQGMPHGMGFAFMCLGKGSLSVQLLSLAWHLQHCEISTFRQACRNFLAA